ncbi:MAG: DUF4230 domain-containing protein [Anaerolineae bacterium]
MLRKLAYFFLILFFAIGSFAAYTFVVSIKSAEKQVVQPITSLVRQLVLPATPVILPSSTTIVHQINDLSRLETASVDLEKVITAERNSDVLWGALGETMVFVAHGKVVAGVDFTTMKTEDLQVMGPETVMVHLPEAVIFDDLPVLDNEKSYVADRDTGLLTRADSELETEVRRIAEERIREDALASNVLERANENARQYMLDFLHGLGFENVIFTDEPPPTPPPFDQEVPKGFVLTPVP